MKSNKKSIIIYIAISIVTLVSVYLYLFSNPTSLKAEEKQYFKSLSDTSKIIAKGKLPLKDTTILLDSRKVYIEITSKQNRGTFLLLHGWNLPATDWCNKTSLCEKILNKGFNIVMPDLGKSVYQKNNFPETRFDWRIYPTRQWISDTLIPFLQKKYSLLLKNEKNYLVGLSTGARGVALLLLDFPDLFKGAAALSGDYAQEKMPTDNLMTGYYGTFQKFNERWLNTDNPVMRIKKFKTPIYLGHGKLDKIVPPEQTKMFYDSLKKYHPNLKIKLSMPDAQHDYQYWGSEIDNILVFFDVEK